MVISFTWRLPMEKSEVLRQVLIKLEQVELFNQFVEIVFGYNLQEDEYVYAQYKVANGNITLNIFDNNNTNRFNGYVFLNEDNDNYIKSKTINNTSINFIYLKKCLKLYEENACQNNLVLFGCWLAGIPNIIDTLFPDNISNVFKTIEKRI